jgi:acetylornithine deacetylase/succinyl-diaminopimelate desuccinylase-like protein
MIKHLRLAGAMLFLLAGFAHARDNAASDQATRALAQDIFKQLIEINTTDSVGNVTTAAKAMQQRLLDAGFAPADAVLLGPNERKQNLVARLHGNGKGGKPILLICHLDVVEAPREEWASDPFQFVVKDGFAYGRGTQDIKDGAAVYVATLIDFKRKGYVPDRDIVLALTAGEESGIDNGVDWLLKNHRDLIDAEYVLNPDSGSVDSDKGRIVSVQLGATEKLYADFAIVATNPGGHSSLPRRDNAIYELSDALERLQKWQFPLELNSVTHAFFERDAALESKPVAADMRALLGATPDPQAAARLSADPRFNSILRTICVPTRLEAGHANNALPQRAQATINCRVLPGRSAEDTRQDLIHIIDDSKLQVRFIDADGKQYPVATSRKAFAPPPIRPDLLTALDHVAVQLWPGVPVIPEMESGASDNVYTMAAGIPSYGVSGFAIDRDDIRAHGQDERLKLAAFLAGLDFYERLLRELTSAHAGAGHH